MKKWMTMLVLALVFFMAPTVSVKASGGDQPPGLYIDDERYLLNEMQEGAGWSYDGNYTLTLDGADLKKVDFQPFDVRVDDFVPTGLKIELKGENDVEKFLSWSWKYCTFVVYGNGSMNTGELADATFQFRGGNVTVENFHDEYQGNIEVYPNAALTLWQFKSGGTISNDRDVILYGGNVTIENSGSNFSDVGKVKIYNGVQLVVNCPMYVRENSTILTDYYVTDAKGNALVMRDSDFSYRDLVPVGQDKPADVVVFTGNEKKEIPPDRSEQWNFLISEDGTLTKYIGRGWKAVIPEGVVRIDDGVFSASRSSYGEEKALNAGCSSFYAYQYRKSGICRP